MERSDATPSHQHRGVPHPHFPRLNLLGGFDLACNDQRLTLAAPSRRVLALAALSPTPLDRERAAERLWPELSPRRSRGNLRNALWRIRSACPELLTEDAERVCLAPAVRVDVHHLDRLARGLDTQDAREEPPFAAEPAGLLAELLPGWHDEWLVFERERFRGLGLHALEQLALHRAAAGRFVDALDAAYLAVGADPLRESAVSALIRVHLAEGNRIEALRAYTSFRERVRAELGVAVEPMPELRRHLVEGFRPGDHGDDEELPLDRLSSRDKRKDSA